jgi:hypothetical protein
MRCRHAHPFRRFAGGFVVALVSLIGLQGCYRGGWHDPERMERKMDRVIEDVEEDLEIRAEQRPTYRTLAGKIKSHMLERMKERREAARELKTAFEQPQADPERVTAILKEELKRRSDTAEHEALIDEAAAFYRTLDANQQATFNRKAVRILDWHL